MNKKEPLIDLLIHDLTGPISIVFASVKNLLNKPDRYATPGEQKEVLERILRNSSKAKTLLQELVEVYRSEDGRFSPETFPVAELVRDAFLDALEIIDPGKAESLLCCPTSDEFFDALRHDDIIVEISGKYCHAPFIHDSRKLRQIARNLISNALKHRKKQMLLSVSGESDLIIAVQDDGAGISPKEQTEVFARFANLTDKTCVNVQGLGFGLSCVKTLLEAIGGAITVHSGEGSGTRFTVRIPPLSETQY
jgi:signal transduction histidine kinase